MTSFSQGITTLYADNDSRSVWCVSPEASAQRATALIALLQILLHCEGAEGILMSYSYPVPDIPDVLVATSDVETVITFHTAALGQLVGDTFQSPSLPVLARMWLETPGQFQFAPLLGCIYDLRLHSQFSATRRLPSF